MGLFFSTIAQKTINYPILNVVHFVYAVRSAVREVRQISDESGKTAQRFMTVIDTMAKIAHRTITVIDSVLMSENSSIIYLQYSFIYN